MSTLLTSTVGDKKSDGTWSENKRSDVIKVQMPLSTLIEHHRLMTLPPLKLNAEIKKKKDDPTIIAIRFYQRYVVGSETETGIIEKGYDDLKALNDAADRVRPKSDQAPIKVQVMNKLKQLLHSDESSYYRDYRDPNGTVFCILAKLVNNPSVDDSFMNGNAVISYLKFTGSGEAPPIEPQSFMSELSGKGRPADIKQTFEKLNDTVEDLLDGIIKARQVDVYTRKVEGGAGAAVKKLEAWMNKQASDNNSIYSCCKPQLTDPEGFWSHYAN